MQHGRMITLLPSPISVYLFSTLRFIFLDGLVINKLTKSESHSYGIYDNYIVEFLDSHIENGHKAIILYF